MWKRLVKNGVEENKAAELPATMSEFMVQCKFETGAAREFMKEELESSTALIDWLFDQEYVDVYGICDSHNKKEIFSAALVVHWPIGDNKDSVFVPLVVISPPLQKKGIFERLVRSIATAYNDKQVVFPGDTIYEAPRLTAGYFQQRILPYNKAFSAQLSNFVTIDCKDEHQRAVVANFFYINGNSYGINWDNMPTAGLKSLLCHENIRVVALKFADGAHQHMAVVQIGRSDFARVLWYAGVNTSNCLKFLKAISANLKQGLLLDTSHTNLLTEAIVEQTEVTDAAYEYTFYQNQVGDTRKTAAIGLPCFV